MKDFGKFLVILGFLLNLYILYLIFTLGWNNSLGLVAPSFTILIGIIMVTISNRKEIMVGTRINIKDKVL